MSRNVQPNYGNRSSSSQTSSQSLLISRPPSRPPSELLCDLHVYKVPPDLWREAFNNILNSAVTETVSVGIIRVPREIRLVDIREEIVQQLSMNTEELVPRDYVFLRSVGRSLTTLRIKQEYQLKAKHFIPPVAYAPELFILEATPELREALAASTASSQSPPLSRQVSPRSRPNTYRVGHASVPETERSNKPFRQINSPSNKYKSLPHIASDPYRGRDIKRATNQDPYNRSSSPTNPHSNHHNSDNDPYDQYNDPYNPYNYNNKNNKNKNGPRQRLINSEQPGSEWDEEPQNKQSTRDRAPVKLSPPPSAEKGRSRRLDDDSGVAGLSPEDDYYKRNRDDYDNILRRTKDLEKHLHSDRITVDDETEEERLRRLEDLENRSFMDRERWDADQEERRRQAKEDRLKEDERRREKEDEEKRKKENEERRKRDEEDKRIREEEKKRRREEEEKKKKEEEEKQKREKEEHRKKEEEENKRREEDKRQKEIEKMEKEESERKKREEIEKRKREEEERRRKEEEERRQKEVQERHKEEEKQRRLKEDKNEFVFPHTHHRSSPEEIIRDTESARQRRRDEKNQLLKDIENARQGRHDQEKIREELVRKAKQSQHKTTNRRNEARDMWKKKYFEEKKKTAPLEESSNRLRNELDILHKRLVNTLEGPKEKHLRLADARPSEQNNYVIQCTKLQYEIEDIQRRVENARMKLTAEMKLRNQAQGELRALRAELTQRKQSIELNRQHQLASLSPYMKSAKENSSSSENIMMNSEQSRAFYE